MHACARSRLLDPSYSQSAPALLSMGMSSPARCSAMTLLVPPTRSQPTNTPAQRVFRGHRCQRQSRAYWQAPSPSPGPGGPCPARARPRSRPGCSAATSRRRPCCSCSPWTPPPRALTPASPRGPLAVAASGCCLADCCDARKVLGFVSLGMAGWMWFLVLCWACRHGLPFIGCWEIFARSHVPTCCVDY